MMNRKVYIFISFLMIGISYAADVPIIFVHGHKSEGDTTAGFKTWNPPDYTSVMEKILNQHYQGYKPGIPLNCDKNTVLQPMNTTKVIYNFSYYSPDGSPGVISMSEEAVLVYIKWIYDNAGRLRPWVIAPFDPRYNNPPSPDSSTYYPRYVPSLIEESAPGYGSVTFASDKTINYVNSWKKGRFAERLAEFIDKVLEATGAQKVDIVAHSMGGVVARSAIKNYGVANKVRRLITVGTPNHPYNEAWWHIWYETFPIDPWWQTAGEDLELGVGESDGFTDLSTGQINDFLNFLSDENLIDAIATIAGNKGRTGFGAPNDGVVAVSQVHLNSAQFNPVIYAQHSYGGEAEFALTTSTYTTEFIKKWLIDDEVIINTDIPTGVYPYQCADVNGSMECYPSVRISVPGIDYSKILVMTAKLYKADGSAVPSPVGGLRAYALSRYFHETPGDPVYYPGFTENKGQYFLKVRVMDMNHGEIGGLIEGSKNILWELGMASVNITRPSGGENFTSGEFHNIT